MVLRLLMLLVWAGVAGSAVFWGTRLLAQPAPVPTQAAVAVPGVAAGADLSRLLGAEPAPATATASAEPVPPPEASRFQLLGVVAARQSARSEGVALIAVDGKMPRAYRVGAVVDGVMVLQAVQARAVQLGPKGAAAVVSLELPALPPPSTGVPGPSMGSAGPSGGAQPGFPPAAAARPAMPMLIPGAVQPVRPPQLAVPSPGVTPGFGGLTPGRARNLGVPQSAMQVMPQAPTDQQPADNDAPAPPHDMRNLR
jgi:general secretion pathway protein C